MIDIIREDDKEKQYQSLYKQLQGLLEGEQNLIARLSNAASLIHHTFNHHWTGFYLVEDNELVVGPFQGPPACSRISKGKGVCGTSWERDESIVVDNVHEFDGHIACSALSNSEVVIPLHRNGEFVGLLDIDSTSFSAFDQTDRKELEKISTLLLS